jgi:hypothetical protein
MMSKFSTKAKLILVGFNELIDAVCSEYPASELVQAGTFEACLSLRTQGALWLPPAFDREHEPA